MFFVLSVIVLNRMVAPLCALVLLAPAAPATAAGNRAGTVWHVVGPGQTMASIAATHRLRVADLGRWNQIVAPYPVHIDETLRLTRPATPLPAWRTRVERATLAMLKWEPAKKCPGRPRDMRRIWVSYIDFQGGYHDGSIIVHRSLVAATQRSFGTLFRWRFRIQGMEPMAVNMPGQTDVSVLTTGYACRTVTGSGSWSEHSYGRAIDLNPLQNPMLMGKVFDPPAGKDWVDRGRYRIGMVHGAGAARAFTANGFAWGGRWRTLKDWMHFSTSNR
jgi:hypothetical protein